MTNAEKVARLFDNLIGYEKGLSIQIVAQYLFNGASTHTLQQTRQAIGEAKWGWLAEGYVLGSVDGENGHRYCLVSATEEAERVQDRYIQNAAGNLNRWRKNQPVLIKAGLLKPSSQRALKPILRLTRGIK